MKSFIASLIAILCVASASAQSNIQNSPQTTEQTSTPGANSTVEVTSRSGAPEAVATGTKSSDALAPTDQTMKAQTTTANAASRMPSSTTADLIKSTDKAKSASQDLLKLEQDNVTKLTASLAQLQQLYSEGLIARIELEKAQQELADAKAKVTQTENEITSSTQLAAEMKKATELARTNKFVKPVLKAINPIGATVMRSATGSWSIGNLSQVQQFFSQTFGRPLPVSIIGQSATHNRMGWDHRNSVDIGIHPDSQEGRALMSYLQMNGIPFLAFRAAVPGVSTGPHIHIGFPSHRLG
jgi:hypothetical protein